MCSDDVEIQYVIDSVVTEDCTLLECHKPDHTVVCVVLEVAYAVVFVTECDLTAYSSSSSFGCLLEAGP